MSTTKKGSHDDFMVYLHTYSAKPAGDIIHSQKHWLKNAVKNYIGVRERVEVKRLEQQPHVSPRFPNPQRQSAPSSPAA